MSLAVASSRIMDRREALVQCHVVASSDMTRRIPPPPSPPKQSVNISIGRGSPPPGHEDVRWVVVDSGGEIQHEGDLTFPEAWKLKEQLAGGRKVVSPRIEQAVEVLTPIGVPPGVPRPAAPASGPGYPKDVDWTSPATLEAYADEHIPEVAAGANADEELDRLLRDVDAR